MDIWKKAGAVVGGVFASFGGFLFHIQPPQQALSGFVVGFASTMSALIFVGASLVFDWVKPAWRRRVFGVLSAVLIILTAVAFFSYQRQFVDLTFDCPAVSSGKLVKGTELTKIAQSALQSKPRTDCDLLLDFGGRQEEELVWTSDSMNRARLRLSDGYIAFAVSVAAAVFCLLEAVRRPSAH